jgi:hypothetical protein
MYRLNLCRGTGNIKLAYACHATKIGCGKVRYPVNNPSAVTAAVSELTTGDKSGVVLLWTTEPTSLVDSDRFRRAICSIIKAGNC